MKKIIPILLLLLLVPFPALAQEEICRPYDLRCEGRMVQQCNTLGTQWVNMEECSTDCLNGQCDPELMIRWDFIFGGAVALIIIVILVRIFWKRRGKPKPPVPLEKHL